MMNRNALLNRDIIVRELFLFVVQQRGEGYEQEGERHEGRIQVAMVAGLDQTPRGIWIR